MTWSCGRLELDMNERIRQLARDSYMVEVVCSQKSVKVNYPKNFEKFAELIVRECIGILETEIELVKGYKSTACNDFDVRWHEGKIEHFAKLIEKSKKHFGVEE
jgi:predicted transcriptional regulator